MAALKELLTSGLFCAVYLLALTAVLCFVDFSTGLDRAGKDEKPPGLRSSPDPGRRAGFRVRTIMSLPEDRHRTSGDSDGPP